MPREHLAIIQPAVARSLQTGRKRIESRFYHRRRPPCGSIARGDTVHFKLSGGGLLGTSQVLSTKEFANLTPNWVDRLRVRYNRGVRAPAAYWAARRECRYGVLIWLGPLEPARHRIVVPRQYGTAWLLLGPNPDSAGCHECHGTSPGRASEPVN